MVNFESWAEFSADKNIHFNPEQIEKIISTLREIYSQGEVSLDISEIAFPSGQHLLDFAADVRENPKAGEVVQS
jgi:hypothetical protein